MATIKIKSFKFHKDSLTEMRAQDPALAKIAAAAMSARENEINTVHTINLLCWGGPMHGQFLELEDNCTDSQSLAFEMRGMVGSYKRAVDTSKRNYGGRPELDNYLSWCGSGMQARKPEPHEMAPVTRDSTTKATGSSKGFELFGELLGQIDSEEAPVEVVQATETKSHEPICTGVDDFGTEFHIVTRAQELQSLGRVDVWTEVTGRGKKQVVKHRADFHQVGGWFMNDFGDAIRCTLATLTPAVAFGWRVDASFELVTFQVARTRYKVRNTPEKRNAFREKLMKNRKSFADKLLNPAKPADVVPAAPVEAVVVPVVPAAPVEAVVVPVVAPTEAQEVAPAAQKVAPVPSAADEVPQVPKLKHGKTWAGQDLTGWTYGEKLDGCRAFWDGAQFWGKDGQPLHLPEVAATMPAGVVLDGEIWAGRGHFEAARLYVQYGTPSELVRFVAFDAPAAKGTWAQRLATVPDTVERVKVCTVRSMTELAQDVADMMDDGAEGIMCHAPQVSAYRGGRDATLVKVKAHTFCHFEAFFDQVAEAVAPTEVPTEAPTAAPVVAEVVADAAPASQEPAPVPTVADEVPQVLAPVVAGGGCWYRLPVGDVSGSWIDTENRHPEHPQFVPNERQQRLMDEVAKVLDAGAFYNVDVYQRVASALGVDAATLASNKTGVQNGDFGYDVYLARKCVEAKRAHHVLCSVADELALKPGDKLGTLIFNDFKINRSVEVVSVSDDGFTVNMTGKRGACIAKIEASPMAVKCAVERAKERNKRKNSYEEFISSRNAAAPVAEAPTEAPTEEPVVVAEVAPTEAQEVAPASQEPAPVPSAADEVPQVLVQSGPDFESDIPARLAVNAYAGISFSPERRGESVRKEYADDLAQVWDVLYREARNGGTLDKMVDVFQAYRARQARALRAYLASSSRCASAMIVGPARFPVARMNKRADIAHQRLNEYLDGAKVALQRAMRELRPDLRPIMAGDADALDRLTAKLAQAERDHAMMKDGNVAIRKHAKAGQAHQVAALLELGFTERAAIEATKPDYMGRLGFARFELTNSNANIKRIKERIEQIERNQAAQVVAVEGADGVTLEDDAPANRVRLYFAGKPSDEVRADLKAHGFRWAPSVGAWQAYRNWRALTAAQRLAGVNLAEAQAPTEAPTEAPTAAPVVAVVAEVVAEAPEVAPAIQEPAPVPTVADEVPQDLAPVVPTVPALHQKARAKSGAWEAQLWQAGGLCWLAFWVLGAAVPVLSSYATRRDVLAALQRLALGLLAPTEAPTVAPLAALDLVEHTTARGKVLRGVVRADLTKAQAQALDAYTFRKDGGWFIRERHLPEAVPVATVPTVANKVAQVLAQAQAAATDGTDDTDSQGDERAALLAQFAHLEQGRGTATASRNIKRQLKRTWPGVVFGVRKDSAAAVRVTWADGPSEAQVNALVGRFCEGSFDGMKECYEYRSDVFNDLFGGCCYLFTRRDVGDELAQRAIERAFEGWTALPTVEDWRASRGLFDWRNDGQVWARRVRDALEELDGVAELA